MDISSKKLAEFLYKFDEDSYYNLRDEITEKFGLDDNQPESFYIDVISKEYTNEKLQLLVNDSLSILGDDLCWKAEAEDWLYN